MGTRELIADSPPTLAQAQVAADVLREQGASGVLLFGSVVNGNARAGSDLDLMAVFDDIDYDERLPRTWRLRALCMSATDVPVDVLVTDWPEWEHRTNRVKSSIEAAIARHGIWLFCDEPSDDRVNWAKGIGMPKSDLEEAVSMLSSMRKSLSDLRHFCVAAPSETSTVDQVTTVDHPERQDRLASLCAHAALTVEHTLKCLTALGGGTAKYSHDIAVLLNHCPDVPEGIIDALEPLRVNSLRDPSEAHNEYDDISCWRILGTYMNLETLPDPTSFGELAIHLANAAVASADIALNRLQESGIDSSNEQFELCHKRLNEVRRMVSNHNIVDGGALY